MKQFRLVRREIPTLTDEHDIVFVIQELDINEYKDIFFHEDMVDAVIRLTNIRKLGAKHVDTVIEV